MRLVLDTNVVVSALFWQGAPYKLLQQLRLRAAAVSVFASASMLAALAGVLSRPSMARRLAAISRSAGDVFADYAASVEVVEAATLRGVAPDPDDDDVIGTAVAANAEFIVTGDRRLLEIGEYCGVAIISVSAASARIPG